ncbi:MAG TPA: branched-chain amino acid ABC transporter permease [Alphaproteobacteria bacterium]|jgi:branched-chain amino acid transport system permease protein|nr:branched-chain amino acid ABC transporter permease [Alphaproteobacteria bacterium]
MRGRVFYIGVFAAVVAGLAATRLGVNEYYFFAGYVVLQFVVIATAWNILGGYAGYVNFGSAGFFAIGVYCSIALIKAVDLPLPLLIVAGAIAAGIVGLATGYLTLRLRGVYFAIATLALAIVLETLVANWGYVGGAAGTVVMRPREVMFFDSYVEFLFVVMLVLAAGAIVIARTIEHSRLGRGLRAIRDEELAAECMGVPTLKLKLVATTISGALMGAAGAPFSYYVTYVDPASAFNLSFAVNAVAMPMIGGTATWVGPLVGALLLGSIQQVATVTISSELNLLIVGLMLIIFVVLAPEGLVGLVRRTANRARRN